MTTDAPGLLESALLAEGFAPDPALLETAHRRAVAAQIAVGAQVAVNLGLAVGSELLFAVSGAALEFWGLASMVVAGLVWGAWKASAYRLLPAFTGRAPRRSEAMAFGGYVIPIASLWIPYQMMAEIRDASDPNALDAEIGRVRPRPPIGAWWASWIGMTVASAAAGAVPVSTTSAPFTALEALGLVTLALYISAAVAALLVVRRIDADQQALGARLLDAEVAQDTAAPFV